MNKLILTALAILLLSSCAQEKPIIYKNIHSGIYTLYEDVKLIEDEFHKWQTEYDCRLSATTQSHSNHVDLTLRCYEPNE